MKEMAKNYRNKTNYYDNSTRSALFLVDDARVNAALMA